jgi:DNA mismatch repair protein MutS2
MTPQSFEVLEYNALKALLAGRTQTPLGRARALALQPSTERREILKNLKRTSDCVRFFRDHASFGLGGLSDPHELLEVLRIEGTILEPLKILELANLIDAGQNLRATFVDLAHEYPALMELIREIPDLKSLSKELRHRILPSGEIDESASPALREIRQEVQHLRGRIQKRLQARLREAPEAFIQDEIITIRNERFVIPVRVEHKHEISGVIHATSSSGATVFIEPLETIELNNELVELGEREQLEITRILMELGNRLREHLTALERLTHVLTEIDLLGAKARLSIDFDCCEPELAETGQLMLMNARHLVLEHSLRAQGETTVPISVALDRDHTIMVISGPNAGGKTVALKTVGLCALMAQSGMRVPATSAVVPIFHQILADIGDQQSIVANLSTFTAHIQNVRQMAETLSPPALMLLDEVGTGTDPEEGAALAVAIVDYFKQRGALVVATTHYNALKMYAELTPGVVNASVEFDEEKLQPTYRLLQGLAGASSGVEIARRMGLSRQMVEHARQLLKTHDLDAARYLAKLKSELELQQDARAALEQERAALADKYARLEGDFARREADRRRTFEAQLKTVVEDFSQHARELLGQVRDRKTQLSLQRTVNRQAAKLKVELHKKTKSYTPPAGGAVSTTQPVSVQEADLKVGDHVRLIDLGREGIIQTLTSDIAVVQVGNLRFKTERSKLERMAEESLSKKEELSAAPSEGVLVELTSKSDLRPELNLIGCTVEDALDRTDKFLDQAYLVSMRTVRIIHGAGTGALRQAIRKMLAEHPHVERFQPEGGTRPDTGGATMVQLRED